MIIYLSSFYPSNDELFRGHFVEKQATLLSKKLNEELLVFKLHFSIRHLKPKIELEIVNGISVYSFYFPNLLRNLTMAQTTNLAIKYFNRDIDEILKNVNVKLIVSNGHGNSLKFGNILSKKYGNIHFTIIHGETITEKSLTYLKNNISNELNKCDAVFAVSTKIKEYLINIIGFKGNIIINPNGLNQNLINKYTDYTFQKNDVLTITSVGNLQYNKGFDIVLDALKKIDIPFIYYIIGDGSYKQELINIIERNDMVDSVILTGNIPNEKVYELLEKSHYFVLPSRREAFGIVYLEGMITKNITIGRKGQGAEDFIVNKKNGYLISTPEEISKIILSYPSIIDSNLILNGFETAKGYTWEKNVDLLIKVYKENK